MNPGYYYIIPKTNTIRTEVESLTENNINEYVLYRSLKEINVKFEMAIIIHIDNNNIEILGIFDNINCIYIPKKYIGEKI